MSDDKPAIERATVTVPQAGEMLGISRNGSYEAERRGESPTIRQGRRLVVPLAALRRMLEQGGAG